MTRLVNCKAISFLLLATCHVACGNEQLVTPVKSLEDTTQQEVQPVFNQDTEDKSIQSLPITSSDHASSDAKSDSKPPVSNSQFQTFKSFQEMQNQEDGLTDVALNHLLGSPQPSVDPVCRGQWWYTIFDCFKEGNGPVCGVDREEQHEEIVEYNGCSLPQFGNAGLGLHSDEAVSDLLWETESLKNRNWCKNNGRDLDTPEHVSAVTHICTEQLQRSIREAGDTEAIAECYNLHRKPDNGKAYCHFGGKNTFVMWSGNRRILKPTYHYRASDPSCGRKMPVRHQKVSDRTFKSCRHPDFGREPSNVCNAPEFLFVSAHSLKRSDLNRDHFSFRSNGDQAAVCSTCDNLPYANSAQLAEKLECLKSQMRFMKQIKQDADRGDTAAKAFDAEETLEAIRTRGTALFEATYSSKPTGLDFLPFYNPQLAEVGQETSSGLFNTQERIALQNLCRGLLATHVDPKRIVSEYSNCLTLATLTDPERSLKRDVRSRAEAMGVAMNLFARYVRAMEGGEENGRVEANTARFLVQSWYAHAVAHLSHLPTEELERVRDLMQDYADQKVLDLKTFYQPI